MFGPAMNRLKLVKWSLSCLSRSFSSSPGAGTGAGITLYQYQICPFCNRVKAYLDYTRLSYDTVEVNPTSKKEIAFSGHSKVPIATINGNTIADSMKIIEYLRDSVPVPPPLQKENVNELWTEDTEKWARWSEIKLAVLLYPNITRTFGESWKAFKYCQDVKTWSMTERFINRYIGPVAMYLANFKIKKKYGIVDERRELDQLLTEWTTAVGSNRFLHGDKITLPDLMVFGVLRGIEDLPTFTYAVNSNSALQKWYQNVKNSLPANNQ